MSTVEVARAGADERGVIANLMQLYIHDFSEFWSGTPDGELEADGRFADYRYLDAYWREAGRTPLLLRSDGRLAGFALINDVGHAGAPVDFNMAEFFVVRKHRRAGVGLAAAQAIFRARPGRWEVAVARRNTGALAFWRKAVGGVSEQAEDLDLTGPAWNGGILRFRLTAPRL